MHRPAALTDKGWHRGQQAYLATAARGTILLNRGDPGYANKPVRIAAPADTSLTVDALFGIKGEKIVIELVNARGQLLDERVVKPEKGRSWLVSETVRTAPAAGIPDGMVLVPAATITCRLNVSDEFVPHPSAGRENCVRSRQLSDRQVSRDKC
ncbi:MAG: hypothetical protein MZV63_11475 [Marinilabiliales bacterium]|nr:hypothetical protein [Marinilabiliales bacterium]